MALWIVFGFAMLGAFGLAFMAGLGLLSWCWPGFLAFELEWNPLSAASRAARAERRGQYATALHWYARTPRGERLLITSLKCGLPNWPIRVTVIEVMRELLHLERAARVAHAAGVPPALVDAVADEVAETTDHVWRTAERIGAAARQCDGVRVHPELDREAARLAGLLVSLRELRGNLAAVTLSGGPGTTYEDEARYLQLRLEALGDIARDLARERRAAAA